jgi:ABC-type enterobactin transport system permease subunit
MVVAAISPEHAWKEPILRVVDTIVGAAVGIIGAVFSSTLATTFASKLEPT